MEELFIPYTTKGSLEDVRSVYSILESILVLDAITEIERLTLYFILKFLEGINLLVSILKSLVHLQV